MRRYNLEVLGTSETHWTQVGQQRLTSGELLLYSGHDEENAPHTKGVALVLSKQAQNALIGWESHGPRIIKASFKTKKEGISMNIIPCYAPTNDYNEDAKDQFYDRLFSIIEKCPTKDLTILIGDLSANVGMDNNGYEDVMGRHGLGERNENASLNPPNIDAALTGLSMDVGPPTIGEISMAIRQIKSGKAAGPDNIPADELKADVAATARILHILFNKICDEEQVPTD
ncbi:unnamed protein product [Schistosoma mattheei]|uniref:Uncharacterized protein n=1 Tax=Schistosoma mattheei TaxID=31246 RepID=A0A183PMZ9_9TREM|nr:unnamed protein product [Schistosoma mattheei]